MNTEEPEHGEIERVTGQYVGVEIDGTNHRIYFEENGPEDGIPVICQHTAGNHGQQWRHLLDDDDLTEEYRFIAHDLPFHGKSLPPTTREWWKEDYLLTAEQFAETIIGLADALDLEDPIYMGSSIGGNIVLELADWYPDRFRALIGMEVDIHVHGENNDFRHHPEINTAEANAYRSYGLMAPQGPTWARREVIHRSEQAANGVYRGDLNFFIEDHDYRDKLEDVNPNYPVYILNAEYDFITVPEVGKQAAKGIGEQAFFAEMERIGHFPMSENPELFKRYLQEVLSHLRGQVDELPAKLTPEQFDVDPTSLDDVQ